MNCNTMTDVEIKTHRKQVVKEELGLFEAIDALNDDQFKKIEDIVFEMLSEEQIDTFYFDIVE